MERLRVATRHSALAVCIPGVVSRASRAARVVFAIAAIAAVGALTTVAPTAAGAATDTTASTDPTGAHVRLARRGIWVEVRAPRAPGDGGGSAPATGCTRRWVPTKFPVYQRPSPVDPDIQHLPMPPRPSPAHVAYFVYCGSTYLDSVWLLPSAFAPQAGALDVLAIAQQLARDLPYPPATVHASPDGRALTGMESWFWVEGYSGPVRDAVEGFGTRVEVEAVPVSVRWDFGDGSPEQPGTLGVAAPARSDVVHTYERRGRSGSTTVRASVRLDVRYRVDAEPYQALDPVFRIATRAYPVVQSRAALVAPR